MDKTAIEISKSDESINNSKINDQSPIVEKPIFNYPLGRPFQFMDPNHIGNNLFNNYYNNDYVNLLNTKRHRRDVNPSFNNYQNYFNFSNYYFPYIFQGMNNQFK